MNCTSLTYITIPYSVKYLSSEAFDGCSSLASINVSADNSKYSSSGGILFSKDKTKLKLYPAKKPGTSYTVPDSVRDINFDAFDGCSFLENITIPKSVTFMGQFSNCTAQRSINVASGNSYFKIIDGVLFAHDYPQPFMRVMALYKFPEGRSDEVYLIRAYIV